MLQPFLGFSYTDFADSPSIQNISPKIKLTVQSDDQKFDPAENKLPSYFEKSYKDSIQLGYTKDVLWGKADFVNNGTERITKYFFFDSVLTGNLSFYWRGRVFPVGSSTPLKKRDSFSVFSSLKISLEPGESQTLYFKRKSHHALSTKIYVADELEFFQFITDKENNLRYYVGAILGLLIYNLMLVIFLKNRRYLYYCGFVFSFLLAVLNLNGVLNYISIFENTTFTHYLIVTSSTASCFALLFAFVFLEEDQYLRDFKKLKNLLGFLCLVPIVTTLTPFYENVAVFLGFYIDFVILITLSFLIVSCLVAMKRGAPLARIYLLSWAFVFSGAILYFGQLYGVFEKNVITSNGFLLANLLEMIVLSLGLAYNTVVLEKENQVIQLKAEGKEKYQQLLRTVSHDISNSLQVLVIGVRRLKKISSNNRVLAIADKMELSTSSVNEILTQVKTQEKLLQDNESIQLEKVNLVEIINELLIIYEDALIDKNIIVKVNIPVMNQYVIAEKVSLKNNVFGNMLSNAIKFSPTNSLIKFYVEPVEEGMVKLVIKDSGKGFTEEALKFINDDFDLTFSTPGTKGETGTGFGLRIIKSYLKMYDARITAYNDGGAVFILTFKTQI